MWEFEYTISYYGCCKAKKEGGDNMESVWTIVAYFAAGILVVNVILAGFVVFFERRNPGIKSV